MKSRQLRNNAHFDDWCLYVAMEQARGYEVLLEWITISGQVPE